MVERVMESFWHGGVHPGIGCPSSIILAWFLHPLWIWLINNLPKKVMATLKEMVLELFWGGKVTNIFFALKIQWIFEHDFVKIIVIFYLVCFLGLVFDSHKLEFSVLENCKKELNMVEALRLEHWPYQQTSHSCGVGRHAGAV